MIYHMTSYLCKGLIQTVSNTPVYLIWIIHTFKPDIHVSKSNPYKCIIQEAQYVISTSSINELIRNKMTR